jgi:hypothetical protein
VGFKLSLLLSAVIAPQAAFAGAWTLPEGHGQIVVTDTSSEANRAFDTNGSPQPTSRYRKQELQALIEYGVSDWLTAMAIPSLQHVDIGAPTDAQRTGFGNSEIGARGRLLQGSDWVLSAQGTVRLPGTYDASNPAAVGYTGIEVDIRVLYGQAFSFGRLPAFVDVQLAQRFRTAGPPDEARLDFTFGLRAAPQWLLLMQQFNVISEGAGTALFPANRYHKLQMSAVYDINPQWSLQGGAFTTFAGRSALQENGIQLGAWYRF